MVLWWYDVMVSRCYCVTFVWWYGDIVVVVWCYGVKVVWCYRVTNQPSYDHIEGVRMVTSGRRGPGPTWRWNVLIRNGHLLNYRPADVNRYI